MFETLLAQAINLVVLIVLLVIVGIILGILGYGLLLWYRWRDREEKSLELVTLAVAVPQDNEVKIDAMESIIASFGSLYKSARFKFLQGTVAQPSLSLEIMGTKEDIRFYISCPKKYQDMIEKQIYSVYTGADVQVVDEPCMFYEEGRIEFTCLRLKKTSFYPIKTYKEIPTDPLSAITSTMSKLGDGESITIQLILSPTDGSWAKSGKGFISATKKSEANPEKASYKVDARQLEAIENKCGKPGFETTVRVVACAPTAEIAKMHIGNVKTAFGQFESPWNKLSNHKVRIKSLFMDDFVYKYPLVWTRQKSVLATDEIASIFHIPNKTVETPTIYWLKSKKAPEPVDSPQEGLYIGDNLYRGVTKKFCLTQSDRQRHFYIIGQTGVGKSWLLADMALQDIKAGRGVCFVDPHDTFESILERIPPERVEDVIYFDPSMTDRPMGFNVMECEREEQKDFVTSSIINLMYKLYDPYKTGIVGPRFEHAIRNIMLTVMTEPGATFIEIVRCLTDPSYVQMLLPKVTDPMVRRYWTDQIAQTNDFHKSEVLDYIVSKFGRFITNTMMRNIIGQSTSSFNFRQAMDEGKILIINLAKGTIGEENSSFLGLVLIPKILIAAMSRQDVPEEKRKDFYLYVDEFQNFATQDFAVIMSEARKYHLNLCVANQFISQMDDEVKNAVFGNVGTICSFRVGISDANFLVNQYKPTFSEHDLLNLGTGEVYMKTMVHGIPKDPFSLRVAAAEKKKPGNPELAAMIKKLSGLKYGRPKAIVEAEIARRAKL
ncbi:ATP-binding protein [Patescibacteria group bacterium]|nr:ATP-binding protein [Patescibacteria group bacterium]